MTRSFVRKNSAKSTLASLPPSTEDEIRRMALAAGLDLPLALLAELCQSYPAFESMVRRLPRDRDRFDEPAHHHVPFDRLKDD
jgi:hypothetical protein